VGNFSESISNPVVTRAAEKLKQEPDLELLLPPFAASLFRNLGQTNEMWRRRVGVEPTIRSAKGRIGGFEGRDSHRTIFASAWIIDHHDWASDRLTDLLPD
jgi:hypothetical protein